jgi:hypothetical protein
VATVTGGTTPAAVVYPSSNPSLLSCSYQLADNTTDLALAHNGISDLAAAGLLTSAQAADTSDDSLMVTQDPLDGSDAIVIVNVPGTTETPFAGGGGGGFEKTSAVAAIIPMSGSPEAVALGRVPW